MLFTAHSCILGPPLMDLPPSPASPFHHELFRYNSRQPVSKADIRFSLLELVLDIDVVLGQGEERYANAFGSAYPVFWSLFLGLISVLAIAR